MKKEDKKEAKTGSVHMSPETTAKLKAVSKNRKAGDNLAWSHKNIIKELVEKAHKKEVENESKNKT